MVSHTRTKSIKNFVIIVLIILSIIEQLSSFVSSKFLNIDTVKRETWFVKIGDKCESTSECSFYGAICDQNTSTCKCLPTLPVFNGIDRCVKSASLNESCEFDVQCEYVVWNSKCHSQRGRCVCRGNGKPHSLPDGSIKCKGKQFGDSCASEQECAFRGAICDKRCQCEPRLIATDHIDKCGEAKKINENCFFNEQCEHALFDTICMNGKCSCRLERTPVVYTDGSIKCVVVEQTNSQVKTDPTMIIVLSVMCLMFVIMCVVLHLFSKARWRENRTIFNTPNPRLMNVSLLRDKKCERRSSKEGSVKGLHSREPSEASLRLHSPSLESKNAHAQFRRESRGYVNNKSVRSPTTQDAPASDSYD